MKFVLCGSAAGVGCVFVGSWLRERDDEGKVEMGFFISIEPDNGSVLPVEAGVGVCDSDVEGVGVGDGIDEGIDAGTDADAESGAGAVEFGCRRTNGCWPDLDCIAIICPRGRGELEG